MADKAENAHLCLVKVGAMKDGGLGIYVPVFGKHEGVRRQLHAINEWGPGAREPAQCQSQSNVAGVEV